MFGADLQHLSEQYRSVMAEGEDAQESNEAVPVGLPLTQEEKANAISAYGSDDADVAYFNYYLRHLTPVEKAELPQMGLDGPLDMAEIKTRADYDNEIEKQF